MNSGEALSGDIADDITKYYSKGLELIKAFAGRLLEKGEQKLHDSIIRNQIKSFKSHVCLKVIAEDNKTATIGISLGESGYHWVFVFILCQE